MTPSTGASEKQTKKERVTATACVCKCVSLLCSHSTYSVVLSTPVHNSWCRLGALAGVTTDRNSVNTYLVVSLSLFVCVSLLFSRQETKHRTQTTKADRTCRLPPYLLFPSCLFPVALTARRITRLHLVPHDTTTTMTTADDALLPPKIQRQTLQRMSRTLAFWGSMGRILVRYYLQERDLSATEQQWQVRGFPTELGRRCSIPHRHCTIFHLNGNRKTRDTRIIRNLKICFGSLHQRELLLLLGKFH